MLGKFQSNSFLFFICVFLYAFSLKAETPAQKESLEERFIKGNILVSEWFDFWAERLDLFLVGQKLTDRANETRVKIENSTYLQNGEKMKNNTGLGVILRLPNFEQYWHLKFTDYDDSQERGVRQGALRRTPREKNYGASVGVFRKLGDVQTSFEPRIDLQDPLRVSHSLTFSSSADMVRYRIKPKLEFFASAVKGTGIFEALNFEFALSKYYLLTWVNEGQYEDKTRTYNATNGLVLDQVVNKSSTMSYSLLFDSNNRPSYHLESYSIAVSWSQSIYKRILDYSVTPHVDFAKGQNFAGIPGITFNINLNF